MVSPVHPLDIRNILESGGFDWEKDVKPALGKELDLVGLDLDNGGKDFVALLQPRDESKFADVIRRGNANMGVFHRCQKVITHWVRQFAP